MPTGFIRIRGARQNNLKNLDLDIRTGEMTVFTGPSGSGKSSLVFDTLYAEGQRRYVETFSAYARQFLERMDRPAVDRIDGVPPAIAIDQTNPVRTSRSTVGTMTELNDHLKLLYARAASLFDKLTALPVRHDTPETIYADLLRLAGPRDAAVAMPPQDSGMPPEGADAKQPGTDTSPRLVFTFPVELPANTSAEQIEQWLSASGFSRVHAERDADGKKLLDVVADRLRLGSAEKVRVMEAIELALKRGSGRLNVYKLNGGPLPAAEPLSPPEGVTPPAGGRPAPAGDEAEPELWRYSTGLHCPDSDLRYADPQPALFSFNSAFGACETCRGFGRVIGVDLGLVIPDPRKTLRNGAIQTIMTPAWNEIHNDLMKYAGDAGIPRDTPWSQLNDAQRDWVLNGSPHWNGKWNKQWYGIHRFFGYLESKAYKMHIRVLLSKYRSYTPCTGLRRRAAEARGAALAAGRQGQTPTRCCRRAAQPAGRRRLDARPARGAAGPEPARPDAAADRPAAPLLRPFADDAVVAGSALDEALEAAARRDPHAAEVPVRRRPRLPDARPTEPHPVAAAKCSAST